MKMVHNPGGPMGQRKTSVIGLAGAVLDAGRTEKRWQKWRPSVAVCQQDDLWIDRFELLYETRQRKLAELLEKDMRQVSPHTEVCLRPVSFTDPWDFEEVYSELLTAVDAMSLNPEQENYLVHITTGTHVAQICLYLLTESYRLPGRLLQASPDRGRPEGCYRVIDLDLSQYSRIAARFEQDALDDVTFLKSGISTQSESFNRLIARIERVALASRSPVLLTGPTGAGKTQLARRIYELKRRRRTLQGEFVEMNCATLRGDQALSALFGHVQGAFTGAERNRDGLLKRADQGILFLDEIGELGLEEQAMLLRAIEEGVFLPVGGDAESSSDFQLIAGSNQDLRRQVKLGRFREDLLARIDLWTFELPPLRERREDLAPNIQFELIRFEQAWGKQIRFQPAALRSFLDFAQSDDAVWRANFRDLNAAITRMGVLAEGGRITKPVVAEEIERLLAQWNASEKGNAATEGNLGEVLTVQALSELDRFDRIQLAEVVQVCRASRSISEAGRTLFNKSRLRRQSTNDADRLRKYLQRFGLRWDDIAARVGKTPDPA